MCVALDGMADSTLVRSSHIELSSNQESVNDLRPGGIGWKSSVEDRMPSLKIFVGQAFIYGGNIRLPKAIGINSWDVILKGGTEEKRIMVCINIGLLIVGCCVKSN